MVEVRRLGALLAAFVLLVAACDRDDLISTPDDGAIVDGSTVTVTGTLPAELALGGVLTVNGVPTALEPDRTWSVEVPHATSGYVTPIEVLYDPAGNGPIYRQRRAVVRGATIGEGQFSPDGVGMRVTNSGLDGLGPVIEDLAGGAFDIGGLLIAQNPIIDQDNAFLTLDILGNVFEAGVADVGIVPRVTDGAVRTDITITDLYVGVDLNISDGLLIDSDCSLELQIPTTTIVADFDLAPSPADPTAVDVTMIGAPAVTTTGLSYEFISGICDGDRFLIGDIVNAVAGPQVESLVSDGFASNLADPDGPGPLDSPIADAIETALAEISIAGPIGEALQAHLDTTMTSITESSTGLELRADADFFATPGAGPSDCPAVPGAPDLPSTYDLPGAFPTLGATTPGGSPYGLGLMISGSAFNQLLGAMTECGAINSDVTDFPFGQTTVPITSTLLAGFIPEFATALPADTPLFIRVTPTVAPFLTEAPAGPSGELAELMLANLQLEVIEARPGVGEVLWLRLALDAPLGFDLAYDAVAAELAPTITPPAAAAIDARVIRNAVKANEPAVEALFPNLFPLFADALTDSFAAFPLPGFLGLDLDVLEVDRAGQHYVLYADLDTVPQTHIEKVEVTDLSSADSAVDSVFDVNEWRHRLRVSSSSTSVAVDFKGMLGADACCTVDDESRSATAAYRIELDVVPADGETWQLDVGHLLNGAHTIIDERVAFEVGGGVTRFDTPVTARARIGGGAWQSFDFAATPSEVVDNPCWGSCGGSGTKNVAFGGGNSLVLTGTTAQTITVEFSFSMFVKSDSNLAFPAVGGDEAAIRFGANDTIANGFTAGGYPGLGNRSIVDDGHFAVLSLTSTP